MNRTIEDEYVFDEVLGKGAYGVVKRCSSKSTLKEYAVKIISKRCVGREIGMFGCPRSRPWAKWCLMHAYTFPIFAALGASHFHVLLLRLHNPLTSLPLCCICDRIVVIRPSSHVTVRSSYPITARRPTCNTR